MFKFAYENARLRGSVRPSGSEQVIVEDESVFKRDYKKARLRGSLPKPETEQGIVKGEVEQIETKKKTTWKLTKTRN